MFDTKTDSRTTSLALPAGLERRRRVAPSSRVGGPPARVTVVIPCYNYARFLGASVASVLGQSGVLVNVVIVDDASTDDSLTLAHALSACDSRIHVVAHRRNQGPVATFNDGLALAEGEFIVRLDADDLLTPGSLSRSVSLARAWPSVGLVYGHPVHFEGAPPKRARTGATSWTLWPGTQWLKQRCSAAKNVITAPEVLMRAAVVEKVGGQRPLAHSHDLEMWLRMAAHSDVGHIEGADQAWHREHELSLSAREVDMVGDLFDRRSAFEVLFASELPPGIPSEWLLGQAKAALAHEALTRACHQFDRGRGSEDATRELLDFAIATRPQVLGSRQGRALRRRMRIGAPIVPRLPWYVAQAAMRRVVSDVEYRRWSRGGV